MKKSISVIFIFLIFMPFGYVFADTGVFFGAGNQVMPIKNNDIQMVAEEVDMKTTVENNNGVFGVTFIPWVNVTATFHFKNTAQKAVSLQVGFPFLDLQGFGDEAKVLNNLDFKVVSNNRNINVQPKDGVIEKQFDPKGLFKKVYVWDERFGPQETKTIVVTYKMLMGVVAANANERKFNGTDLKYQELDRLFPAVAYNFMYITKTAYTWKGPVEKAVFQFDASEFLKQLNKTPSIVDSASGDSKLPRPIYLENVSPAASAKKEGVYSWVFNGTVPQDGLSVEFIALFLPTDKNELKPFVERNISKLKDATADEYISVLKQYYAILAHGGKPSGQFLSGYFKDVRMLSRENSFLFEDTKNKLADIVDSFDVLEGVNKNRGSKIEPAPLRGE